MSTSKLEKSMVQTFHIRAVDKSQREDYKDVIEFKKYKGREYKRELKEKEYAEKKGILWEGKHRQDDRVWLYKMLKDPKLLMQMTYNEVQKFVKDPVAMRTPTHAFSTTSAIRVLEPDEALKPDEAPHLPPREFFAARLAAEGKHFEPADDLRKFPPRGHARGVLMHRHQMPALTDNGTPFKSQQHAKEDNSREPFYESCDVDQHVTARGCGRSLSAASIPNTDTENAFYSPSPTRTYPRNRIANQQHVTRSSSAGRRILPPRRAYSSGVTPSLLPVTVTVGSVDGASEQNIPTSQASQPSSHTYPTPPPLPPRRRGSKSTALARGLTLGSANGPQMGCFLASPGSLASAASPATILTTEIPHWFPLGGSPAEGMGVSRESTADTVSCRPSEQIHGEVEESAGEGNRDESGDGNEQQQKRGDPLTMLGVPISSAIAPPSDHSSPGNTPDATTEGRSRFGSQHSIALSTAPDTNGASQAAAGVNPDTDVTLVQCGKTLSNVLESPATSPETHAHEDEHPQTMAEQRDSTCEVSRKNTETEEEPRLEGPVNVVSGSGGETGHKDNATIGILHHHERGEQRANDRGKRVAFDTLESERTTDEHNSSIRSSNYHHQHHQPKSVAGGEGLIHRSKEALQTRVESVKLACSSVFDDLASTVHYRLGDIESGAHKQRNEERKRREEQMKKSRKKEQEDALSANQSAAGAFSLDPLGGKCLADFLKPDGMLPRKNGRGLSLPKVDNEGCYHNIMPGFTKPNFACCFKYEVAMVDMDPPKQPSRAEAAVLLPSTDRINLHAVYRNNPWGCPCAACVVKNRAGGLELARAEGIPLPIASPSNEELAATWCSHASYIVTVAGLTILTDPVWSDRCSPVQMMGPMRMVPVPIALHDMPYVDAVTISHNHYDHLCTTTVRHLCCHNHNIYNKKRRVGKPSEELMAKLEEVRLENNDLKRDSEDGEELNDGYVSPCKSPLFRDDNEEEDDEEKTSSTERPTSTAAENSNKKKPPIPRPEKYRAHTHPVFVVPMGMKKRYFTPLASEIPELNLDLVVEVMWWDTADVTAAVYRHRRMMLERLAMATEDAIVAAGEGMDADFIPSIPPLLITVVPAQHWSMRQGLWDRDRELWGSFVYRIGHTDHLQYRFNKGNDNNNDKEGTGTTTLSSESGGASLRSPEPSRATAPAAAATIERNGANGIPFVAETPFIQQTEKHDEQPMNGDSDAETRRVSLQQDTTSTSNYKHKDNEGNGDVLLLGASSGSGGLKAYFDGTAGPLVGCASLTSAPTFSPAALVAVHANAPEPEFLYDLSATLSPSVHQQKQPSAAQNEPFSGMLSPPMAGQPPTAAAQRKESDQRSNGLSSNAQFCEPKSTGSIEHKTEGAKEGSEREIKAEDELKRQQSLVARQRANAAIHGLQSRFGTHKWTLFHSGDTGYYDLIYEEIYKAFGAFDFSMIAIGAYEPRKLLRQQHLDPIEAVEIHDRLKSRRSAGMHWGTWILSDEPIDEPPKLLSMAMSEKYKPFAHLLGQSSNLLGGAAPAMGNGAASINFTNLGGSLLGGSLKSEQSVRFVAPPTTVALTSDDKLRLFRSLDLDFLSAGKPNTAMMTTAAKGKLRAIKKNAIPKTLTEDQLPNKARICETNGERVEQEVITVKPEKRSEVEYGQWHPDVRTLSNAYMNRCRAAHPNEPLEPLVTTIFHSKGHGNTESTAIFHHEIREGMKHLGGRTYPFFDCENPFRALMHGETWVIPPHSKQPLLDPSLPGVPLM